MLRAVFALLVVLAASPSLADDRLAMGGGSVMVGPDYMADGSLDKLRLSMRGEGALLEGDVVGLALVLPVDLSTSGPNGYGVRSSHTLVEIAPSFRARLLPGAIVRPYADIGVGPWLQAVRRDVVFDEDTNRRSGWVATAGLGLELGSTRAGSAALIVEPLRLRTYTATGSNQQIRSGISGMVGVGLRY